MSEQESEDAVVEAPVDVVSQLTSVVADLDPDAMPINIITIVEWLEPDGSYSMSNIHTPMPVWHMRGMLSWAEDVAGIVMTSVESFDCSDGCECGECEDDD